MSDLLSAKCPECGAENFYENPQRIRCISCCFDETIPAVVEYVVVGQEEIEVEEVVKVKKLIDIVEAREVKPAQRIKRGCTFEVDDKGKVVRIVSNG